MLIKGTLIPIGGNEDKGGEKQEVHTMDFITDGILSHVVEESGGTNASIIVIPTASQIPEEVGQNYITAFKKLGCQNVKVLNIRERAQTDSKENLTALKAADCIMFSGGDQSRIVDIIGQTKFHSILKYRFQQEPIVIAGTSAGAMAMSSEMIAGGSSSEALLKGAVKMREGMSFIPQLIIDSHFIQRGRFGRLAEAVARFPHLLGVGLAEDTGMVIKNRNEFKIIGSGMVILFDPEHLTHNNVEILEEGTPMSMSNLTVHVLANGDCFTIDTKKLEVLGLDSDFE